MRKLVYGKMAAVALALAVFACGCGKKESAAPEKDAGTTNAAEETTEPVTEQETLSPEQMDLVKYNYYVELNNDIVEVLDNIEYYYEVVEEQEEFALIQDSGLTYGYRIVGLNTDIVDDCLELADMEPAFETLDPLVKEMAVPLKELMDAFSQISRGGGYADNQYQKPKEYHAIIYPAVQKFEALGFDYIDAVKLEANGRLAQEEEKMKAEGRLIAYNSSHAITIAGQILDECREQGITDENLTELDLTNIKPMYDELVETVNNLNAATADNQQIMLESISNSRPFDGLYEKLIQALEWMIKQVESGKPIEDISLKPLGSLAHFSNTLGECIDRYNSVIVE